MSIGAFPLGGADIGSPDELGPPALSAIAPIARNFGAVARVDGPLFLLADFQIYAPGDTITGGWSYGSDPIGSPSPEESALDSYDTLRASDAGYRTPPTDSYGWAVYPPKLDAQTDIDREVMLSPFENAIGRAWGAARFLNSDGTLDSIASSRNADGRPMLIRIGRKVRDDARGYFADPLLSACAELFAGIGGTMTLEETALSIPFRDATYWLERSLQANRYAGTGTYEGPAAMAGMLKPKTRGGTSSAPVRRVTPVVVDAANGILQYTDAAGTVVELYEGGHAGGITFAGDTTDLYAGSTPAGQYRTDNSRGLLQLGTYPPAAEITIDCTGAFPSGSTVTTVGGLAQRLMIEDMLLPGDYVETGAFAGLDAALPLLAGWHWKEETSGVAALSVLLRSANARLAATRTRQLRPVLLRALPADTAAVASYGTAEIASLRPVPLSAPLTPPAARWRVGWGRNHTLTTSGFLASITAEELQEAATEYRVASWFSAATAAAYLKPNDPEILETALLGSDDGDSLAAVLGDLWGVRRRVYEVELPVALWLRHEIGDPIVITWPADDLRNGKMGMIFSDSFRAGSAGARFLVLV
jgi:hypothetical protein